MGLGRRVQAGDAVNRIVVIGDGAADIANELGALSLSAITTHQEFQIFASALADPELNMRLAEVIDAHMKRGGAPQFGNDRPYLKKKKGRS